MRTSNPVLSRQDAFTPYQAPQGHQGPPGQQTGRMTLDDVLTKTGITIGLVVLAAAATFFLMPPAILPLAGIGAALSTIVITFIVAFRRTVSPALVVLFALIEGVFVGAISKFFENAYSGIVTQAIFGTLVAAVATLGAYKFFNIRVTAKFTKIVGIATLAFAVATLANFLLALAGVNGGAGLGLRSGVTGQVSLLAIGVSAIAVVLAVLNLVLDFDYIERGIEMGAPANQSWKAAFGLTVTLVWLYVEILRILSYFRR
ncbi:Bax inhibitor-1/YccA family protein [Naumannella sp. ID2617S]|nr:Bax inhibitor-1/YccA family protein [Naumannella sp. ID2617S]